MQAWFEPEICLGTEVTKLSCLGVCRFWRLGQGRAGQGRKSDLGLSTIQGVLPALPQPPGSFSVDNPPLDAAPVRGG